MGGPKYFLSKQSTNVVQFTFIFDNTIVYLILRQWNSNPLKRFINEHSGKSLICIQKWKD